jgi:hypothetical protein
MFRPSCHSERSEGSDSEAVILSEAKDLFLNAERSFVATLVRTWISAVSTTALVALCGRSQAHVRR